MNIGGFGYKAKLSPKAYWNYGPTAKNFGERENLALMMTSTGRLKSPYFAPLKRRKNIPSFSPEKFLPNDNFHGKVLRKSPIRK